MTDSRRKLRLKIVIAIALVLVVLILYQYTSIMVFQRSYELQPPISFPTVERGPILDRNGRILAIQTRLASVSAWIPDVEEPEDSARALARILTLDEAEILDRLTNRTGFVWLERKIPPSMSMRIEELREAGKLPGINLEPEFARHYPERRLAAHLVGFVGDDGYGLAGIEQTYNDVLAPPLAGTDDQVFGNQVFLTIDVNAQHAVQRIVSRAYDEHRADSVMALVADAKSGEVLVYVSAPGYDANDFQSYAASARRNRPIALAYEPGSVLKVFTLASILELGGITPEDTFFCPGHYPQNGDPVILTDLGAHGTVDAERILKYSCNVGAATASEAVNAEAFYEMLRLFGFSQRTGVPLPGESYGILRRPEDWSSRSKPTIAMGQEISVTAMQMVAAATALANDGTLLRPHVVRKVLSPDGKVVKEYEREPLREVVSPRVAKTILHGMQSASGPEGTARRARIEGVATSAKTGTAEMLDPATGTYSRTAFVASCLSIFPTEDPELIVYVVIEHPKGENYYGGVIAAPVAREIAEEMVTYFGIRRADDRVIRHPGRITVPQLSPVEMGEIMPDLTGLPKRALLPLYDRHDLRIIIRGDGWVVEQSPAPGTPLEEEDTIVVELQ